MKSCRRQIATLLPSERVAEAARFVVNGLFATAVHFGVLTFCMEVLMMELAAVANFIAAVFGITTSFLGNRYFVFRSHTETLASQAFRFAGVYASIAVLHAGFMFVFADYLGHDFRIGFVIATFLQVALSYFGNRHLVFAK